MEILDTILNIAMVVFALGLIIVVLAQKSKTGGLGAAFGGESAAFTSRGKAASREAKLQKLTVILAICMGVLAIAILILSNFIGKTPEPETTSLLGKLVIR